MSFSSLPAGILPDKLPDLQSREGLAWRSRVRQALFLAVLDRLRKTGAITPAVYRNAADLALEEAPL